MYRDEVWMPISLRPNAVSPSRYDDLASVMRGQGGRALDLGCGAGQLVFALADRFEALVGVDISDVRIRLADSVLAERYPQCRGRVTFHCVDPDAPLPFPDRSFDMVMACAVLEAVPDVFATLDEVARVCRPGGYVLISVANACYLKHVLGMLVGRIPLTWGTTRDMAHWRTDGWDGGALRYFSKGALRDLLLNTGFVPERWSGNGTLAKLRRWYPNLCGGLTVRARRVVREGP
jgi:SAM-dependent methyltransferase